jgi:O-antigen ligase
MKLISSPLAPRPSPPSWGSPPVAAGLAVLAGIGVGVAAASGGLLALVAAAGLATVAAVAASVRVGLLLLVAVASLLPFAVIPLQVGVQLTAVDALLGAILLGALVRLRGRPLELPFAGRALAVYLGVAVAALVVGAAYAPLGGPALRSFLKYAAAISLFVAVVNVVRGGEQLRELARALVLGGTIAAGLGLLIHALPRPTIVALLSALRVVGYPSGPDVLRFRPAADNTYTDVLRATGTSIDPNVFGGLLMLAATLMLGQWFAPRPVVPRPALVPFAALSCVAMVLSDSRSSWVGLAAATAFLATTRYRKLWLFVIPAALFLLALPIGQEMLERLVSGFTARDRASALRLDEYRQAVQLIGAYPILGVGFGDAPEAGTFVGVSSIYLLVGEHTGLVGLGLFLASLAALLAASVRAARTADLDARAMLVSLQATFIAALVAGLFDHYFMNPRFPHMVALFWLYAGLLAVASRLATPRPIADPRR